VAAQVAFAGDQVSVTLSGIDLQNVSVGYILCDPTQPIPVTSHFEARIIVFDIKIPITKGYSVSSVGMCDNYCIVSIADFVISAAEYNYLLFST
jgi:translation elongation factor EF-1alpha